MLEVGYKFKVERCIHTDKGDTLLYLISMSRDNKNKKTTWKNYSFFIKEKHVPYNKGDSIVIESIDGVDRSDTFSGGRKFVNVNVYGDVSLYKENKSAIEREIEETDRVLPF